jgi:hypothetical protein
MKFQIRSSTDVKEAQELSQTFYDWYGITKAVNCFILFYSCIECERIVVFATAIFIFDQARLVKDLHVFR